MKRLYARLVLWLTADYDAWQEWVMGDVLKALGECAAKHRKTVEAWPQ